jgi:hypothetical protein
VQVNVPVRNDDGSTKFEVTLDDKQMQAILQFGLNFLVAAGLASAYGVEQLDAEGPDDGEMYN